MSEELEPKTENPPSNKKRKMEASNGFLDQKNSNGSSSGGAKGTEDIDEGLYSRQLYVLGHQAMKKMATSRILISGMSGLGAEIAKNVILSGMQKVCLHDTKVTQWSDLSSHFFLSVSDVGTNRAEACLEKMRQLNSYVEVTCDTCADVTEILENFDVVVLVDALYDDMIKVNNVTHSKKIKLHCANSFGLFSVLFNDFGEEFVVQDVNGEEPISAMLSCVLSDGTVTCHDETRHGFEDGDYVTFTEVEGLEVLNNCDPVKISVSGPYSFKITGDLSTLQGKEGKGGYATQVKMPQQVAFKKLDESYAIEEAYPSPFTDFAKMDRPGQIKVALKALNKFVKSEQRYPKPWSVADSQNFVSIAKEVASKEFQDLEVDESLLTTFSKVSAGNLSPMAAAMGGISGQEVLKACTGKFMPIKWLFFDAVECLPDHDLTEEECKPLDCRYDGQIAVFGKQFQDKIGKQRNFVVGAGAIGCELLKNYSMVGVGAGQDGMIYVTDMDTIEKSNLNRQFLFRSWDVGQQKSVTAAKAICQMNPEVKVTPHENRVGIETEKFYDDKFFAKLDCVTNALDNIEARTYMDRRCVYYRLPLLESGTLGTKGNTQVVIPHLTESYSSSQDPPEKSIPICTLKNFPNQIEHTLQWARDTFEGLFTQSPLAARQYLEDPENTTTKTLALRGSQPIDTLEQIKKVLIDEKPNNYEDCVMWARKLFEALFSNQIKQLLHNFPPDQKTSTGQPFWSGPKRCPHPLDFNVDQPYHLEFVKSGARLLADVYQINVPGDEMKLRAVLDAFQAPKFVPKTGLKIASTDEEAESISMSGTSDKKVLKILVGTLSKVNLSSESVMPLDFEKDDDSNGHLDFIVAASNLRAENYGIAHADRHKSKLIAGRIIPAIATTTSLVAGLVSLEMLKLVQGHNSMDKFKNGFANLALPFITMSEPIGAAKQKYYDTEWTLWDRFDIENKDGTEMTLGEFLNYFKTKFKIEISMISQGVCMLYAFFQPKDLVKQRENMKMSALVEQVGKKSIQPHVGALVFEICANDEDGEDVDVPYVNYKLPKK